MFINMMVTSLILFSIFLAVIFLLSFLSSKIRKHDRDIIEKPKIRVPSRAKKNVSPFIVKGYKEKYMRSHINNNNYNLHYDRGVNKKFTIIKDLQQAEDFNKKRIEIINKDLEILKKSKISNNYNSSNRLNTLNANGESKSYSEHYDKINNTDKFFILKTS